MPTKLNLTCPLNKNQWPKNENDKTQGEEGTVSAEGLAHLAHFAVHWRPPREVDPVVHEVLDAVAFDHLQEQARCSNTGMRASPGQTAGQAEQQCEHRV